MPEAAENIQRLNPMEEPRPADMEFLVWPQLGPDGQMYLPDRDSCTCDRGVMRVMSFNIGAVPNGRPMDLQNGNDQHNPEQFNHWLHPERQECPVHPGVAQDHHPEEPRWMRRDYARENHRELDDVMNPERFDDDPEYPLEREQWRPYFANPAAYEMPQDVDYYFDHHKQKIGINTSGTELDGPER